EIVDGFAPPFGSPFGKVIAAAKPKLISLAVLSGTIFNKLALAAAQFLPKLIGDFPRDVLLDREYVGNLPVVAIAPDLRAIARAHQLGLYNETIALLRDPAGHNGVDVELLSQGLWLDILPLVAECRRAGHYFKGLNLGQAVDDAFGHAVGEVIVG